mgnify:CR=1 FL=1
MGINDDGIAAVGKNLTETTLELLSTMADEEFGTYFAFTMEPM